MVFYLLLFTAELENLTDLQPRGGCDDPDFPYYFKMFAFFLLLFRGSYKSTPDRSIHPSFPVLVGFHFHIFFGPQLIDSFSDQVKCENCGETSQKETCVVLSESVPLPTGRGTANLVQKCKLCGREGTIQMVPGQGQPLTLEDSQTGHLTKLMVFDSRGFEPVDFSFRDGWKAESVSGTAYDVDLSEGEFADYDEKENCPVGISSLRASFRVAKKQSHGGGKIVYV